MSIGMSMYEVASFLKDAGCVTAIYLDGGGSATVAACYEGTDELVVRNSPVTAWSAPCPMPCWWCPPPALTATSTTPPSAPQNELYTPAARWPSRPWALTPQAARPTCRKAA